MEYQVDLLNTPQDVSCAFTKGENTYFCSNRLTEFDAEIGQGCIEWKRYARKVRMAFNQGAMPFEESEAWEFPPQYAANPALPFAISFVSERAVRLRMVAKPNAPFDRDSIMLAKEPPVDTSWRMTEDKTTVAYQSTTGSVIIHKDVFNIELRDSVGRLLTKTQNILDKRSLQNGYPLPVSFVRQAGDFSRKFAMTFLLSHDEKIYGCGESFTRLNKRGQKLVLWTQDPHSTQTRDMYKPVPFYMSSRGYGVFMHTSAPVTCDFGHSYDQAATLYIGEDFLDIFIFLGDPKEILSEYTALTGRSPVPPLWTFGLWMSRITYGSEKEVRKVAKKMRAEKIPCDVLHLDTGWFEEEWRCDYQFSAARFPRPQQMVADLKKAGFHISLWQLPYFTPTNAMYAEAVANGYVVLDGEGNLPTEDAVIDFSNPAAVAWYQGLLATLFDIGVEAIKADFGEGAPYYGCYASGKSGLHEHNLYPLRYNRAVAEITQEKTDGTIIWGRSAWAGSQRYPVHWGGDAENTGSAMAATLRAGLSLGLCGFSFWSHDIGGFVKSSPEELYKRWLGFGMLTSHSRCHGAPPKEPWHYSDEFAKVFKKTVEMKYKLMPYIYEQAKQSAANGFPMIRTIFFEYPADPTAWLIEDAYFFGSNMLVAPLMEENQYERDVYLPAGNWIDYQTGIRYSGEKWHTIASGEIPCVILVKSGSEIAHIDLAQSTSEMDWNTVEKTLYV